MGIVTSFTYRLTPLPNGGRLSTLAVSAPAQRCQRADYSLSSAARVRSRHQHVAFGYDPTLLLLSEPPRNRHETARGCTTPLQIDYARGVNNTVEQFMAFQKALPTLDKRFGLTYGLGQAKFSLSVSGLPHSLLLLSGKGGMLSMCVRARGSGWLSTLHLARRTQRAAFHQIGCVSLCVAHTNQTGYATTTIPASRTAVTAALPSPQLVAPIACKQGLFLGEPAEALKLLREAGMLEGLEPERKVGPAESDTAAEQPIGVVLKAWPSFYEYSIFYVSVGMGCRGCGLSPLVAAMPCEGSQ